ncbi:hypothetical protein CEXT_162091 [Caerostris extrusa]|uniref:Secreted protein n=1 Tax=Caerostris extrusa TaxID=172846 RepID=A0AAV4MKR8_CAEEX|nr:hypothetical protein CEXT_162091 [Caerostris extrusa]
MTPAAASVWLFHASFIALLSQPVARVHAQSAQKLHRPDPKAQMRSSYLVGAKIRTAQRLFVDLAFRRKSALPRSVVGFG